jgi:uncharacterized protein
LIVRNATKQVELANEASMADSFVSRGVGLLGRAGLPTGAGLIIRKCNSVHCMFMRFTIDVIFADKSDRILHIIPRMKPFRVSKIVRGGSYVVALPAGVLEQTGTEVGDTLEIIESAPNAQTLG